MRPDAETALKHWKEFLPQKYKLLKEQGRLNQEAEKVAGQAAEMMVKLTDLGMTYLEAREVVQKELIYLEPEEQVWQTWVDEAEV